MWIYIALFALAFLVLDVLALSGVELAVELLAMLGGAVVGILFALAFAYPLIRKVSRRSPWRFAWLASGIGSAFAIIFGASFLTGVPPFPTADAGNVGVFIYGAAFGFGVSAGNLALGGGIRSVFTGNLPDDDESRAVRLKFTLVALGAVAGLFAVCFLGYLAIEYMIAPIVRSLA